MAQQLFLFIGLAIPWGGTWLGLNSIRGSGPVSGLSCHAFWGPRAAPATAGGTGPLGAIVNAQSPPPTTGAAVASAAGAGRGLRVLHHLERLASRD